MTVKTSPPLVATLGEARKAPLPAGRLSALLMQHGTMQLRHYRPPKGGDPQKPHDQDERYVVMHGSGFFRCDERRTKFGPGDVLYAGAGAVHRFEDYSDDTELWVVFYGPKGGEA
jgi:mannose-6-phosphate isomerase-like protein (cupin superfamily)